MDALIARAVRELEAGVDELAEKCEGDLIEQEIDRTLDLAVEELIAPLYSDKIDLPYMLRKGHIPDRPAQQATLPEPPPTVDAEDSEEGSDEAEIYVPDAEIQQELIELPSGDAAEFVFLAGKTHVYAWEYLGDEWSSDINDLHKLQKLEQTPETICANLHPWQSSGAARLLSLAQSPFKGGILADEMGLGKTLQAITVGESLLGTEKGAFNLVICPKSCAPQWREELVTNVFPPPKVLILEDPHMTATELLDRRYTWVICSYEYARARYNVLVDWQHAMAELNPRDTVSADQSLYFKSHPTYRKQRPTAPLHSAVYQTSGKPILAIFFDEAQIIKNENSATYDAAKAIPGRYRFMLSGTIFHNRWSDIFGPVSLLKGHPFPTRDLFQKAFAQPGNSATTTPSASKRARLVKFLQRLVIARPSRVLELPELHENREQFVLDDPELVKVIMYLVKMFYEAFKRARTDLAGLSAGGESVWKEHAMYCINVAQVLASNQHMLRPQEQKYIDKIKEQAVEWADEYVKHIDHEFGTPDYYHAIMMMLDKHHTTHLNRKRSAAGHSKQQSKRLKPDPRAAIQMSEQHGTKSRKRVGSKAGNESLDEPESQDHGEDADWDPTKSGESEDSDDAGSDSEEDDADNESLDGPDAGLDITGYQAANSEFDKKATTASADMKAWKEEVANMTDSQLRSPRVRHILTLIRRIKAAYPGEKVLVFSRFRKILDIVERVIEGEANVFRFDGTVAPDLRQGVKTSFSNAGGPKVVVMLVTAGCGGAGLNLESANHVIIVEPWWRRADEQQAIGRAYRHGQTNEVHVWRLHGINAIVDSVMETLQGRKAATSDMIMEKLRLEDGQLPQIPKQFKGGAGEVR